MGMFDKFREGLRKTQDRLTHEIRRIATFSPKLTQASLEELEVTLIGADFGLEMTRQIVDAVRRSYEGQGRDRVDLFGVARAELETALAKPEQELRRNAEGLTRP